MSCDCLQSSFININIKQESCGTRKFFCQVFWTIEHNLWLFLTHIVDITGLWKILNKNYSQWQTLLFWILVKMDVLYSKSVKFSGICYFIEFYQGLVKWTSQHLTWILATRDMKVHQTTLYCVCKVGVTKLIQSFVLLEQSLSWCQSLSWGRTLIIYLLFLHSLASHT